MEPIELMTAYNGRDALMILKALHWGRSAHDIIEQKRKYSGEAYWHHPERVALTLARLGVNDWEIIAAALLHDVLEDVYPHPSGKGKGYSLVAINDLFGSRVARTVHDLTDVYTKEAFPLYNRKERHAQELIRLSMICDDAKIVKLSDIRDNTEDIMLADPAYGKMYLAEKRKVVDVILKDANEHVTIISKLILDSDTIIGQSIASQTNETN